ncbi:MAG TPA: PIN domain-containing protein [Chloroflexota bacterium]|nr:PIN domain-containing protein [Chloroflexota bacterium]
MQRRELVLAEFGPEQVRRAAELMGKYSDTPMDLADATLVSLAEERGLRQVFSLDKDFHIYRFRDQLRFEVLPA